jgi:hypothetical protein
MTLITKIKPNRCKNCKTEFSPCRPLQVACSPLCALEIGRAKTKKAWAKEALQDRKLTREKLETFKTNAKWEAECRAIVQKLARIRDRFDGCISCNLPASWRGQWHGSHYRSHGAASAVQFNLWNIHKACSACNLHKSGNIIEYRPRLIAKIGQSRVDWLMSQNKVTKLDVAYYKKFKLVMGKRLRRAEKRIE